MLRCLRLRLRRFPPPCALDRCLPLKLKIVEIEKATVCVTVRRMEIGASGGRTAAKGEGYIQLYKWGESCVFVRHIGLALGPNFMIINMDSIWV